MKQIRFLLHHVTICHNMSQMSLKKVDKENRHLTDMTFFLKLTGNFLVPNAHDKNGPRCLWILELNWVKVKDEVPQSCCMVHHWIPLGMSPHTFCCMELRTRKKSHLCHTVLKTKDELVILIYS